MGLSDFFSSGGSNQTSFSGLRGLGNNANLLADSLVPSIQSGVNQSQNMFYNPTNFLTNGLYTPQANLLPNLVSMAASKMSAQAGARGQVSPENVGAIAGSAAQNLAPFLMPLMGQNISDIRNSGGNVFASLLSTGANALGNQGNYQTAGPGLGYVGAGSFMKSFGEGLGNRLTDSGGMGGNLKSLFGS